MIEKIKQYRQQKGFTLVETLVYIFITIMILMVVSSLVMNVLNVRKKIRSSNEVQNNARFILNFVINNIHNVDVIDDVSPAIEQLHFYKLPDIRFSLSVESGNLVYRETQDVGIGFPDQSTATPVILNTNQVTVSNFTLTPITDSEGNINAGAKIDFVLTTGETVDIYGYSQQLFSTFISIR